jgi:hypothetical protein
MLPSMMFVRRTAAVLALMLFSISGYGQADASLGSGGASASWQIGPFQRPPDAQPIITRRPEATFLDPILGKPVHWEALHTFNPAAIVRNGKVVVLPCRGR